MMAVIGMVVFYAFLSVMALGAWSELKERPKKRVPDCGKWIARRRKRWQVAAPIPTSAPMQNRKKPQQKAEPQAKQKAPDIDPLLFKDLVSALRNLGYRKIEAAQAVQRSSGNSFEPRLKGALVLLRAEGKL